MFHSLDVGCGVDFRGDVNVDLYPKEYFSRKINLKRNPNFIVADCHYLPFNSKSFETVFCSHLLEHLGVDVTRTVKELLRVSKEKVVIRVPSAGASTAKAPSHNKIFTAKAFDIIFANYKHKITFVRWRLRFAKMPIRLINKLCNRGKFRIKNPFFWFPFMVPTEIKVEVYLKNSYP